MSAAKCQFPFSYRRKSEEAMTAVIWLGCSRCFPLCQWNSSPSSSNEIANSQVAVLVLCIGFIGFDKLSSVCKIYLSNQAAEGAILLHSPDPTSPPPRMASFATNQPTNHMGKKRAHKSLVGRELGTIWMMMKAFGSSSIPVHASTIIMAAAASFVSTHSFSILKMHFLTLGSSPSQSEAVERRVK